MFLNRLDEEGGSADGELELGVGVDRGGEAGGFQKPLKYML